MKRFLLLFLSAPTVLSVVLPFFTATVPAMAAQPPGQDKFCVTAHGRFVCVKSAQLASNDPKLALIAKAQAEAKNPDAFVNFSDKESDDAAAIFGCDCPACIRSLRQLRAMAQIS
jgi:hypothetical protein